MVKVSVVVPIYNSEKYLKECINSIINQTIQDIEILCVNDGSTDNSLNILNELKKKDKRIIIFNQKNSGAENARNVALNNASGEYISFVDSDDWVEPIFLEKMVYAMEKNQADLVECRYKKINETNIALREEYFIKPAVIHINKINLLKFKNLLWNKLFKREIIEKYNIRLPNVSYYGDNYFSICYPACCTRSVFIDNYLYNYRCNSMSLMQKYRSSDIEHKYKIDCQFVDVFKQIIIFFSDNNLLNEYRTSLQEFLYSQLKWRFKLLSKSFSEKLFRLCMREYNELSLFNRSYINKCINNYFYKVKIRYFLEKKQKIYIIFNIPFFIVSIKSKKAIWQTPEVYLKSIYICGVKIFSTKKISKNDLRL